MYNSEDFLDDVEELVLRLAEKHERIFVYVERDSRGRYESLTVRVIKRRKAKKKVKKMRYGE